MEPTEITPQILQNIHDGIRQNRDEIRKNRDGLVRVNERIDRLSEHVDEVEHRLSRRIVETEVRLTTAIVNGTRDLIDSNVRLAAVVADMQGALRAAIQRFDGQGDLGPRVERCEKRLDALEGRRPEE